MMAIATESGWIHLVDTDKESNFDKCHLMIHPLENAVTDVDFSEDDSTLAIGCGDKTMKLIDMQTQKIKMSFNAHWGCIKQVRFRPGDPHVIATCCREGIVNLWDSRCRGEMQSVHSEIVHGDARFTTTTGLHYEYKASHITDPHRSWPRAHSDRLNIRLINDGPNVFR
jgi:WD40 repeat protein